MKEKQIILAARAISMVFTPFYLPLVGLAALSGLDAYPARYQRAPNGALYHCHYLLFCVLLPHELTANTPVYVEHSCGSARHPDSMRHYKCMVEDLHPHGSYRRFRRSAAGFLHIVRLQSTVVVLRDFNNCRHGRQFTHDIAPAQPLTSRRRFPRRSRCRLRDDYLIVPWQ